MTEGDHITVTAGGKVCVDMHSIWENVERRLHYENEWVEKEKIRRDDPEETRVPKQFFTKEERASLILTRPWVGPNGFSLDSYKPSFRSRREHYLIPSEPAGGLVAGIGGKNVPSSGSLFFAGQHNDSIADKSGELWFTVNDVQFDDPTNRELFYDDNIGSFWVKVIVKRK